MLESATGKYKTKIFGYRVLPGIKISALHNGKRKKRRKILCAGKGQVQAFNGSFRQLSFVSTEGYIPFTRDEYCLCLQKDPGWVVGISKSFFYISACVV